MGNRITIEHVITLGDSLSDRGTMKHRKLFDLIPMDDLSGLKGKSPEGRFTNGKVWIDDFSNAISEDGIIQDLEHRGMNPSDIADGVIDGDPKVKTPLRVNFNLNDDRKINYKGQDFVRTYNEGGLTAYDYSGRLTRNLKLEATEQILSTLDEKRKLLLEDDKARGTSLAHKEKSLIIEWSGANDLITVNTEPTEEEAEKAVAARIHNVNELIENGYCNFALFNLPDLSLTPRYQRRSKKEQEEAHRISLYFNKRLSEELSKLQDKNPYCVIDLFDVNETFTDAYNNPSQYGFDPEKIHTPLTESKDFGLKPNGTSSGKDYMFWDDVHPTAKMHEILFDRFYTEYNKKYHFTPPHESLIDVFRETYGQKLKDDKRGIFGFFRHSNLNYLKNDLTLETILKHALDEKGHRTRQVIIGLGWINEYGELISKHPSLKHAMANRLESKFEEEQENHITLKTFKTIH